MPKRRALPAALPVFSPLVLGTASLPSEPHLTPAASYPPRLVVQDGAPAAPLPARNSSSPHPAHSSAGPGVRRDARFRAGSITKTFVAPVVLQLVREGALKPPAPVDRYLPGPIRGHGNDGAAHHPLPAHPHRRAPEPALLEAEFCRG